MIEQGKLRAAGFIGTQGIRGGASRETLKRISETGSIFLAWSDRPWLNEGAAIRISVVGFDDGMEKARQLNGQIVEAINADLTSGADATVSKIMVDNKNLCFMGRTKVGAFDLSPETARKMIAAPRNPNGRPNSDVVRPWANAIDITRRPRGKYIIDFGVDMHEEEAALYELPFEYIQAHVKNERLTNNRESYKTKWWIHAEPRPALRKAIAGLRRFVMTPRVAKYRIFVWAENTWIPDSRVFVFARDDDYFFGSLHSSAHEIWSLATCSWHGVGNGPTYNGESCFETFPFPWPPGTEPSESDDNRVKAIADAARDLVRLRDNWLNPPDIAPEELKNRTLTNLYNKHPEWLANAHRTLNEAVFAAYGWPASLTRDEILARLLALNHQRAAAQPARS